jgi:hypothetical protein
MSGQAVRIFITALEGILNITEYTNVSNGKEICQFHPLTHNPFSKDRA